MEACFRNQVCCHLDLGLPKLQNSENYLCVVSAIQPMEFVTAA